MLGSAGDPYPWQPISDQDAGEIARWLRAVTDDTVTADRLERIVDAGNGGLVATNRAQAQAIITAVAALADDDPDCAERLEGMVAELDEYIRQTPHLFER